MASQGLSRVQADKCLNNTALAKKITDQRADIDKKFPRFEGTPSFMLNGLLLVVDRRVGHAPACRSTRGL